MKRRSQVIFLILIPLFSCDLIDVNPECGGNDPSKNLKWMKEMTDNPDSLSSYGWFQKFTYLDQTYFILGQCCPACFWIPIYYDCEGNIITFSVEEQTEILTAWQNEGEVVWQGGGCSF